MSKYVLVAKSGDGSFWVGLSAVSLLCIAGTDFLTRPPKPAGNATCSHLSISWPRWWLLNFGKYAGNIIGQYKNEIHPRGLYYNTTRLKFATCKGNYNAHYILTRKNCLFTVYLLLVKSTVFHLLITNSHSTNRKNLSESVPWISNAVTFRFNTF